MHSFLTPSFLLLLLFSSLAMTAPEFAGGGRSTSGSKSGSGFPTSSSGGSPSSESPSQSASTPYILIAHAVMACVAWTFLAPIGSVLLRLNINHPTIFRLHVAFQILTIISYIAAAGMGIWLCVQAQENFDIWADPHPTIGLVILACMLLQPIWGWVHHRIYKARAIALGTTNRGPRPGRTIWGRIHLWIGRGLITLGVINGGLGLRLMETSPMQDPGVTRDAEIGYGIAAGTVWCIYVFITMVWEGRRSMRLRKERYDDSQARKERTQSSSNSSLEEETSNVS